MQRLLARAKKDKIGYAPFDFEYFCYPILDFTVYGEVIERTGLNQCYARVFSAAAPTGERGEVDCFNIDSFLSREQFEDVRVAGWPNVPPASTITDRPVSELTDEELAALVIQIVEGPPRPPRT